MIVTRHTEVNIKMTLKEFKVLEKVLSIRNTNPEGRKVLIKPLNETEIVTLDSIKLINRRKP